MTDTRSRGTILSAANFNAEKAASRLRRAMRGIGTDEKVIIDVLTSHTNVQRQIIKKKYKVMYGIQVKTLHYGSGSEIGTSGFVFHRNILRKLTPILKTAFKNWRLWCSDLTPSDNHYFRHLKQRLASQHFNVVSVLSDAAAGWLHFLTANSFEETISNAVRRYDKCLECIDNRPAFFARQLHEALNGPGTDDKTVIRILVSRSEIDLSDIQEWYHMKYDEDLSEAIYADTSGDYRKILLKILSP
ncbi:Annexin A11 [Araneus ventricosus]|uniref:Annexin n=1 Tax=Araneus ventricosus TaxID=182803 RepID=A0A4Y2LV32_ARAVE|nr:Annexin A11 [Araneus ventricosus]